MTNVQKILVPVDFPNPSLPVIRHAVALARHFRSEIVMLHVASPQSHAAGVPDGSSDLAAWDMTAEIAKYADSSQDKNLGRELHGIAIHRVLATGDVANAIVYTAQAQKAGLIMMPSHGHTFCEYLLGSVTSKVLRDCECPIWTDAHVRESPFAEFAIRHILCSVEFNAHDRKTVSWAAYLAAEFGARLTLAHVTTGVEFWGPGGGYVNTKWKDALVEDASLRMSKLQQQMEIKTEVFIGSGEPPQVLCQAASQTKADLLITGCHPYGGRLRTHGYAIVCAVPVPVLSV
jgi:nucleotide-binding universal stress UspA family protein